MGSRHMLVMVKLIDTIWEIILKMAYTHLHIYLVFSMLRVEKNII